MNAIVQHSSPFDDGCSAPASSCTVFGEIQTGNDVVVIDIGPSASKVTAQVQFIGSGTLFFETTIDGGTWFPLIMANIVPGGLASASQTTVNGVWQAYVAGWTQFRVRGGNPYTGTFAQIALSTSGSDGSAPVFIGDVPPSTPGPGTLWWSSTLGNLFIWYDDGTSAQWVPASSLSGPIPPPVVTFLRPEWEGAGGGFAAGDLTNAWDALLEKANALDLPILIAPNAEFYISRVLDIKSARIIGDPKAKAHFKQTTQYKGFFKNRTGFDNCVVTGVKCELVPPRAYEITGVDLTNPVVIHFAEPPVFTASNRVRITGCVGAEALNNSSPVVTPLTPTTYSLNNVDGTNAKAFNIFTQKSISVVAPLTLDGTLVGGGVATITPQDEVNVTSFGNNIGLKLTFTGTNADGPVTEVLDLGNQISVTTENQYATITSIVPSGLSTTDISIGTGRYFFSPWISGGHAAGQLSAEFGVSGWQGISAVWCEGANPTITHVDAINVYTAVAARGPVVVNALSPSGFDCSVKVEGITIDHIHTDYCDFDVTILTQYKNGSVSNLSWNADHVTNHTVPNHIIYTQSPNPNTIYEGWGENITIGGIVVENFRWQWEAIKLGNLNNSRLKDTYVYGVDSAVTWSNCNHCETEPSVILRGIRDTGFGMRYVDRGNDNVAMPSHIEGGKQHDEGLFAVGPVAGSGPLTLNGSLVVDGVGYFDPASPIRIASVTANENVVFTVTGTNIRDQIVTDVLTLGAPGAPSTRVVVGEAVHFKTVTEVSAAGACVGPIAVGQKGAACAGLFTGDDTRDTVVSLPWMSFDFDMPLPTTAARSLAAGDASSLTVMQCVISYGRDSNNYAIGATGTATLVVAAPPVILRPAPLATANQRILRIGPDCVGGSAVISPSLVESWAEDTNSFLIENSDFKLNILTGEQSRPITTPLLAGATVAGVNSYGAASNFISGVYRNGRNCSATIEVRLTALSSPTNVRTASPIVAGPVALTGITTVFPAAPLIVTSTGNDTGVSLTIVGTNAAGPVNEVLPLTNAGVATMTNPINVITSVTSSGASAGNVSIGTGQPMSGAITGSALPWTVTSRRNGMFPLVTASGLAGLPAGNVPIWLELIANTKTWRYIYFVSSAGSSVATPLTVANLTNASILYTGVSYDTNDPMVWP